MADDARLRIGVSNCLTGAAVRFDGGHKNDPFVGALGEHLELLTVCPEVELGLGIPRETLRLVRRPGGAVALVTSKSDRDLTSVMTAYAQQKAAHIAGWGLDGFILKKDSPSCGMERVKVYDQNLVPSRVGRGLFAAALQQALPLLPVEDEGRLGDPALRDNFLVRVHAYRRLNDLFRDDWTQGTLVQFHARSKLLLLAHNQAIYRQLGPLVAHARSHPRAEVAETYRKGFLTALGTVPHAGTHGNVLQHMAGYFRTHASGPERIELQEAISDYRLGRVPRAVPLTLIRHHARRNEVAYLLQQWYLDPYPRWFFEGRFP